MIRIYYMKLEGDCSDEQSLALYKMLPKERKESVDRAKSPEIAKKRLYTGAFLQYVLSKETGLLVEELHYRYNQWGKPELENVSDIHFNLSHSGEWVVLAISDESVGIDVECKNKGYEALARRCFCEEEYIDIISMPSESERERRFLEYWTMKEAYIKYVGEGMRIPLNSFRIEKGLDGMSSVLGEALYFKTWFLEGCHCISICCPVLNDIEQRLDVKNIHIQDVLME